MLEVSCLICGNINRYQFNVHSNLVCQKCGSVSVSVKSQFSDYIKFICVKCAESFTIDNNSKFDCSHKCGSTIYEIRDCEEIDLTKITTNFTSNKTGSYKMVVPYYDGGLRIERAIQSWIREDVVFATCDKRVIPPGSGICSQFFTPVTTKTLGICNKNLPLVKETFKGLYELYPYEDYYGYFNSDIILPQGIHLSYLLPSKNKIIALHHRVELIGYDETPRHALTEANVVVVGKDGFIFTREVLKDILNNFPEMVIGIPMWDTALAIYLANKYGIEKIDLCYKEIKHVSHYKSGEEERERYNTPEGEYNKKVSQSIRDISSGGAKAWGDLTNKQKMEEQGLLRRKIIKSLDKIGIIQPGRLGDIIICLPIAKYYYDQGYTVYWPVMTQYLSLFEKINYIKPLDAGANISLSYNNSKQLLSKYTNIRIIDLAIGFGRDETDWRNSDLTFDQWKYEEAEVLFEEKYNLKIIRNYRKEKLLKEIVNAKNRNYVVTHSASSFADYDFSIPDSIEVKEIKGYDIFDWIGIIENAEMVFTVDSAVMNLVNQLNLCEGNRFYHDWQKSLKRRQGFLLMPKLKEDWQEYKFTVYKNTKYPKYLWDDNAQQHILYFASKYCKGNGIDLGGGTIPYPNCKNIDIKNGKHSAELKKRDFDNIDFVFSSHFLEHLTKNNYYPILNKIFEYIKKGGHIFFYLPHPNCKIWHPSAPDMGGFYGHKQILRPEKVKRDLVDIGFEVIEYSSNPDFYYSYYIVAKKPERIIKEINSDVKLSFIMIVLNGMPTIKAALKSIQKEAHEIIILEGALDQYKFIASKDGLSTDGTTEFLKNYAKENKNVVYLQANGYFATKQQMHNVALDYITGNYIWLIDSDEVYHEKDIAKVKEMLKEDSEIDQINFRIINFFKGKEFIMESEGNAFRSSSDNIRRIFKYKKDMRFIAHRPPQINIPSNKVIEGKDIDIFIYHFSYCMKKQVKDKVKYYAHDLQGHRQMNDWYHNFYIRWTPGNRKELECENFGPWPPDKNSRTERFKRVLPKTIKEISFDDS